MRRAGRRALAAVALAAAGVAPAVAALTVPGAEDESAVSGEVLTAPAALLEPGETLSATVRIENDSFLPLDEARVELAVTTAPLGSTAELAEFLDSPRGGLTVVGREDVGVEVADPTSTPEPSPSPSAEAAATVQAPATISRLDPGITTVLSVTATAARLPFDEDDWGVHGVVVRLRTDDGTQVLEATAVTWQGDEVPELTVAAIAPAVGSATRVRSVIEAADVPGVTLALDPTALVTEESSRVNLGETDAVRVPMLDPDLVSLAHAGDETLLEYAIERSEAASAGALRSRPWLAMVGTPDAETLALAARLGAPAVLAAADEGAPAAAIAKAKGQSIVLLRPDGTLSAAVATDAVGPGAAGRAVATAALTAARSDAPVLVSTGTVWLPTRDDAGDALAAVMEAPFVSAATIDALLEGAEGSAKVPAARVGEGDDLSAEVVGALAEGLAELREVAATAENPSQVLDPVGEAVLAPLTTALRGDRTIRSLRIGQAKVAAEATLDGLSVAAGSEVNLIATRGSLPVTVSNDLDVDATVRVDITSFSPNLQIRDAPEVTIPAGATTSVLVEVEAVSSADVSTRIVLRNADGVAVSDPETLEVRVRADWGNAVTAVFTAGLVVLLVMGVIRTIRRGRKDTRTGPTEPVPPRGDEE